MLTLTQNCSKELKEVPYHYKKYTCSRTFLFFLILFLFWTCRRLWLPFIRSNFPRFTLGELRSVLPGSDEHYSATMGLLVNKRHVVYHNGTDGVLARSQCLHDMFPALRGYIVTRNHYLNNTFLLPCRN